MGAAGYWCRKAQHRISWWYPRYCCAAPRESRTADDASGAPAPMSDDIEWITMIDYKIDGRGPQKVFEGMLLPAMQESEPYTLTPYEFICDGNKVVSIGRFKGTNRMTGKHVEVDYSHIWEVRNGSITRHRQFIDTGKIEPARHPG